MSRDNDRPVDWAAQEMRNLPVSERFAAIVAAPNVVILDPHHRQARK